jgi:hypothetical protein
LPPAEDAGSRAISEGDASGRPGRTADPDHRSTLADGAPDTAVGTWGPDVERYALSRGVTFDRAQRDAVDRALAFDKDRRLVTGCT